MKLKKGDIVTFDRGYNNYAQFSEFCDNSVYFVTRLKDNAAYKVIKKKKNAHQKDNKRSNYSIYWTDC